MITRHCTLLSAIFTALLVGACDGTVTTMDPDSSTVSVASTRVVRPADTGAISGLWDASTAGDTLYIYIDRFGHWYGYDYAADSGGDGNNCHYIFGPYALQPLGEHRYLWHDPLGNREIELIRDRDSLLYTDAEGEWHLTALAGVSNTDLTVCGKVM